MKGVSRWSSRHDLNVRPLAPKASVLPAELLLDKKDEKCFLLGSRLYSQDSDSSELSQVLVYLPMYTNSIADHDRVAKPLAPAGYLQARSFHL